MLHQALLTFSYIGRALQIAPVVDASSSQSRADVLVILLSAVLLLSGLQWLALKPKTKPPVGLLTRACPDKLNASVHPLHCV